LLALACERDVLWLQINAKALSFEAELLGLVEWD